MLAETIQYIDDNQDRFIGELIDFLKIPSISAKPESAKDTRRAAKFVADEAKRIGLEHVDIIETPGYPVVYADWLHAENKPTVLIYGHYDVQPPEPLELWTSPPFNPEIRGGDLYARGSIDDKGQVHLHMKAIESLLMTQGKLPVNVKLIIEGEEEVGSANLPAFVQRQRHVLKCDAVMISDTTMYDYDMPAVTYGLRGLAYFEVHITGPDRDLHSGMFGGPVANPVNALCELVAKMKDKDGRITIPNFYDDVVDVSADERAELQRLPYDAVAFNKLISITETVGEKGYSDLERLWARPTLDLCGISGGYEGEGAKTVLPSKAFAKVSFRLVANQDYIKVGHQLRQFVHDNLPRGVTAEVVELHGGPPALTPVNSAPVRAALAALEQSFGVKPFLIRSGGSIPIVADFERILGAPVVLMGFGLPDQNAHSPDEKMNLANYHRGIKASAFFMENYAALLDEHD